MEMRDLTLREKVGQKFIFGINSHNIDIIIRLIEDYHIGGIILYKSNYDNYEQMLEVINRLKRANAKNKIPLFISIDQEGGKVNRMPLEFKNFKNIYDISMVSEELIYESADITGEFLHHMGINMNFAPVMDIYDGKSKVLYKRCFCKNIAKNGINYANGLTNNGVISVVKHFPGHGATNIDSHFITPYVHNYRLVLNKHILPFEEAIKSGVDAIMVGHLVIRGLTNGLPASISYDFITKYLRGKYGFDGLIITDEINMLSKNIFYRFSYMKRAMLSSCDMILVKINDNDTTIIDRFIQYISDNKEYQASLDESVERIVKIKNKYKVNDDLALGCKIDEINEKIENINNLVIKENVLK